LMHEVGSHLTDDLSRYFSIPHGGGALIERAEFERAREQLQAAGFRLRGAEESWSSFMTLRARYASALNAMARFWAIPPAQWIGDRSPLNYFKRHAGQTAG